MVNLAWLTSSRDGDTSPCAVSLLWDALQIQASQNHVGSQDLGTRCFRSRLSWLPAAKIPQNTPCTREMSSCDLCRGAKGKSEEGSAVLHGASSVPRAWCTPWDHPVLRWLFQQPSCCLDSPGTAETSPGPIPKSLSLSPTRDAAATSPPPERSADLSQHHALHRGAPFGPKGDPGEQLAPSAPRKPSSCCARAGFHAELTGRRGTAAAASPPHPAAAIWSPFKRARVYTSKQPVRLIAKKKKKKNKK